MDPRFISPVANPQTTKSKMPLIAAGVALLLVIVGGIIMLIASNANNPTSSMDKLNARMNALSSYVAEGRKSARSADLVKLNTDASILLTGDATAIRNATGEAGAKGKTKDVVASEKQRAEATLKELKSAAVDGRFDREYVATMKEELSDTQTLLREVNDKSSNSSVKLATKTAYEHISTIIKSLDTGTF